ncbi:MAG: choice-of-anchor D domain-containing protein [Candidatus Kapabacteria bacterium]|nr:choice-of-anchor D domain-containing protein [Candidatus Kapabacteria bacterium]
MQLSRHLQGKLHSLVVVVLTAIVITFFGSSSSQAQCVYGWGNLTITAPTAGSSWLQNTTMTIRWNQGYYIAGNYQMTYRLDYSSNNGTTWNVIASNINGYTTSYNWLIPNTITPTTTYRVRVSEVPDYYNFGCAFQNPGISGTFTVIKGCNIPTIRTQPQSQTVCTGQPVTFTVASDMTTGTYEWFRDGVSLGVSRTPSYTIPSATLTSAGLYSVLLRDDCDPVGKFAQSATARLTVNESPSITTNLPLTRTICENANDTLRIRALGAARRFQWFKDNVAIAGATDSNYVINNAGATATGKYYCVVSGTCNPPATSATCDLTVAAKPRITREPIAITCCPGSNGNSISVQATGLNLAYQWYQDGKLINGATSATLTFNTYDYSMNGQYYCMVRSDIPNPNNCVISAQSRTVRVSGYRNPIITAQPKNTTACLGSNSTIVSEFTGTGLNYQWFKNGQALSNARSNTLVLTSLKADDAGRYVVVATGTCDLQTKSDTVTLTIITRPTITTQPVGDTLTTGEPLAMSITATDAQTVQWFRNDIAIKDATTANYSVGSVKKSDAGFYTVRVTNLCGGVVSAAAKVVVNDPVVPRPAIELSQTSVEFGEIPQGYNKTVNVAALIKNVGNAPLSITALTLAPSDFTVSNAPALPFEIAPGGDQSLTFVATPTRLGAINGTLTVRSNSTQNPQVTVALTAAYVLRYTAPGSQDFGVTETGKSVEKCMTITNTSAQEITIDQASFLGSNAGDFSIVTTLPVTIAAGASAEICVKFAPAAVGKRSAQLALRSSNGGNTTIGLSGTAETPGGVIDAAEAGIVAFPNPATDMVELRFGKAMPAFSVSIVNTAGRTALTTTSEALEAGASLRLNLGGQIASGAYTLVVRFGEYVATMPLTVVR